VTTTCSLEGVPTAEPCTLVIFGGSGDLTHRKLLPSLYNMARNGLVSERFAVLGTGSTPYSDDDFRARFVDAVRTFAGGAIDEAVLRRLVDATYYIRGRFNDAREYAGLVDKLTQIAARHQLGGNRLFYLAVPPQFFATIATHLGASHLVRQPGDPDGWTRLIIEKPFGHDLDSARALNRALRAVFDEAQIHRIDHYLGKETVQNILTFRFVNGIFEPVWNRRYVDHVQITVAEKLGVEGRGGFYEAAGALRDVLQNHIFQLLCLVAMEPPISMDAEAVRNEKVKVLDAIKPMSADEIRRSTVRGQYGPGTIDGARVPGYREEEKVDPRSATETYAAMRLNVENWRWADVPFYLRTGKRLAARTTEIVVQFRRAPLTLLRAWDGQAPTPNRLTIHIQPDERITLHFHAKCPGPIVRLAPVAMEFCYADLEGTSRSTGYETLIYDAMIGDQTLFHRDDMVESAWRVATPILQQWAAEPPADFPNYAAGSWGPVAAAELLARDGRVWSPA
jgi:glucose-6-phosphate 1-dehydrogenase